VAAPPGDKSRISSPTNFDLEPMEARSVEELPWGDEGPRRARSRV
jgi:hypothetical protein